MNTPLCPVCGKEMVANIAGKAKNPKAPDWKCSNRNCKFQWNEQAKNWVVSEYITGIWDEKPEAPNQYGRVAKSAAREVSESVQTHQAHKDASMQHLAERRDAIQLVIAEMAQGGAWTEVLIQERIKFWVKWLHDSIYDPPFVG